MVLLIFTPQPFFSAFSAVCGIRVGACSAGIHTGISSSVGTGRDNLEVTGADKLKAGG